MISSSTTRFYQMYRIKAIDVRENVQILLFDSNIVENRKKRAQFADLGAEKLTHFPKMRDCYKKLINFKIDILKK